MNPDIQIIGLQPSDGSSIARIRRWPEEYLPTILTAVGLIKLLIFRKLKRKKPCVNWRKRRD